MKQVLIAKIAAAIERSKRRRVVAIEDRVEPILIVYPSGRTP